MAGHGVGRFRRALEAQGYEARQLILATSREVPGDCTLVVTANPRTTFLPAKARRCVPIWRAAAARCCCSTSASCSSRGWRG